MDLAGLWLFHFDGKTEIQLELGRESSYFLRRDTFGRSQHIQMEKYEDGGIFRKTSTNTYENVHSARASPLPCGLLIDETLLQCVGETLVNQGVADEGSSLTQRGFQLTTFINIHTGQNPI